MVSQMGQQEKKNQVELANLLMRQAQGGSTPGENELLKSEILVSGMARFKKT
jgi:hypothetical protein